MEVQEKPKKATHEGELHIAGQVLPCAVLEDGTRILTLSSVFKAFGRIPRGKSGNRLINMPSFVDAKNLKEFINKDIEVLIKELDGLHTPSD